jgi:hypothetical protein
MDAMIADLTVEQLKELVRVAVREALEDLLPDPDAGLELRDEVVELLREARKNMDAGTQRTVPAEQVWSELGLDK